MNRKFHNAINGIPQSIPPIWFMRQAGRYHSHYQNLRKKYSFEELCKNSELAAEVACGPIDDFDYDVAILFSDILYPLELFDLDLSYNPGPTFTDYLKPNDIKKNIDNGMVEEHLNFQSDAIKLTKEALSNDKSLVGFIGGPWTILSYGLNYKSKKLVDDITKENFIEILLYEKLIPILRKNIQMQLEAGVEIVYIFDTNSKQLESNYFLDSYLQSLKENLFRPFEKKIAYFSKNESFYDENKLKNNSQYLAGTVYPMSTGFSEFIKGKKGIFVQGNFSPEALLKPHEEYLVYFEEFLHNMKRLNQQDRSGWICSLSHGVLPKTPEENVRHFIHKIRDEFSEG